MFENEKFGEILTILKQGGVILYPTDTVWAVGCDATNLVAVEKLISITNRPDGKGFVLLVDSIPTLKRYVADIHPRVETLLAHHTRPLTMIYEKPIGLPEQVLAMNGSVAIRVTQDAFCRELLSQLGKPMIAATANTEGAVVPLNYGSISSDILEEMDMVVKYKQDIREHGELSVMAAFNWEYEELEFLRE
jgi:L-threonylcarbamoyladenylate synthase